MTPRQSPSANAVFALAQAMQPPAQAFSQQMPSTQAPVEHCDGSEQAAPCPLTVVHWFPRQKKPMVQSAFDVHELLHAVGPHRYEPHDVGVTVWQTPDPLQVRAGVYVEPLHDSLMHVVPDQRRHSPAPSHVPSRPQLEGVSWGHSSSGSVPLLTARQKPLLWPVLALLHAKQVPAQADSQQTPSTQKLLVHSPATPQLAPSAFRPTHEVPAQKLPVEQSLLEAHVLLHDVAPHAYRPHEAVLTFWQAPAPLQTRAGVYVEPLHDSGTQVMPVPHLRHAPLPSHMPSLPQVDGVACVQSLSGSVPSLTPRQRPSAWPVLAFTQALQAVVQADSQQTPSTQNPLPHAAAAVQAVPLPAPLGVSVPASASA